NGSPAPARTRLQDEVPPGVELILSDRNVGFSGGNNLGIRQALERGADYLLLINNDATLAPGALAAMVRAAERHPALGLLGGKIIAADASGPTDLIWSGDRKSTRLNSSHQIISYAVFCLKKKNK